MTGKPQHHIYVTIRSPEALIFEGEATMIIAPGQEGMLGLLPGHMPLVTPLRAGEVTLHASTPNTRSFQLNGGLLYFENNTCRIVI
jgi:F-type H+-transporting ATPase subunit epsilon